MVTMLYKWLLVSFLWWGGVIPGVNEPVTQAKQVYHPFYVSVAEINHNAAEKSLEITCRIFADDLEAALKKNYQSPVNLNSEKDKAKVDGWITDYIAKHLVIKADGKALKLQYIGFEKEKESAYCYFEVPQVTVPKKVEISNNILHDYTTDQINILHVSVGGKRQSTKLNYPEKEAVFQF